MSNFIKNQKQRFIIMIITFIMIITAMPNFILATNESVAEDKKAPEVIAHIKSGKRISSKDGLNFTIKDESYMTELIFQWDRNLPNSNTIAQSVPLREEDGKEFVQVASFSILTRSSTENNGVFILLSKILTVNSSKISAERLIISRCP